MIKRMSTPPVSGSGPVAIGSNEASAMSAAATAAAAAAANRERLEQRMRGIFKKSAESPSTTPPSSIAAARSSTASPSPSIRQSTSVESVDRTSTKSSMEKEAGSSAAIHTETNQANTPKNPSVSASASASIDEHEGLKDEPLEDSPSVVENEPGMVLDAKDTEGDAKLSSIDRHQESEIHIDHEETDSKQESELQASNVREETLNEQSISEATTDIMAGDGDTTTTEAEATKESDQQILSRESENAPEESEIKTEGLSEQQKEDDAADSRAIESGGVVSGYTSLNAGQTVITPVTLPPVGLDIPNNTTEVASSTRSTKVTAAIPTTNGETDISTMKPNTNKEPTVSNDNPLQKVLEQREEQLFKVMQEQSSLLEKLRELEDAKAAEDALNITKVAGLEKIIETQKKELEVARGEVLSKKEFKNLTTIKTLRMKNIEAEKLQMDTQKKLDKAVSDHADAQAKISKLMEENRQFNETIKSLHDINQRQNKQITKLESELAHLKEEKVNFQLGLDRVRQELEEARKTSAELSSQAHAAALEREMKLNENLSNEMEAIKTRHAAIETSLRQDIQELRVSLSNREELAGEKEDQLMMEIRSLQAQLERNDNDSYELQEVLDEARRPLLRQIEALQNQQSIANRNWERIEKNLTHRIAEAEEDVAKAQERERSERDKLDELVRV
ncbi:hypothetical protein BGZ65_008153 [Modicella reniformis]|uniref:Uncharacterized protein n=1 Tax=Modicella reniformis TaxID=1440133 RepID=A0A9P6LXC5_9FUNG|nr:hypothetical protein BGZ65_008153 [Modicella reniformis]